MSCPLWIGRSTGLSFRDESKLDWRMNCVRGVKLAFNEVRLSQLKSAVTYSNVPEINGVRFVSQTRDRYLKLMWVSNKREKRSKSNDHQ
jgi:hypothetical protein